MSIYYDYLFIGLIIVLSVLILLAVIKSIIGPKVADRIVSVNMVSTMVLMILCVLTVWFKKEGYLADVSLIYVLISFVAIIVLANVFVNVNMRSKFKQDVKEEQE